MALRSFTFWHARTTTGLGSMSGDPRERDRVLPADDLIEGSIRHDANVVRTAAHRASTGSMRPTERIGENVPQRGAGR